MFLKDPIKLHFYSFTAGQINLLNFAGLLTKTLFIVKIVNATAADIAALVILINSAYRGESSKKGWTTEAGLLDGTRIDEKSLRDLLNKTGATILTCRNSNNDIIGSVYLQKETDGLYLGMLTVNPLLQAGGIGKYLLKTAEDYARKENYNSIYMTVISVRQELIAWYERHGYVKTGETKPFPTSVASGIPKQALELIVLKKMLVL